jgi:hypothetical protein
MVSKMEKKRITQLKLLTLSADVTHFEELDSSGAGVSEYSI